MTIYSTLSLTEIEISTSFKATRCDVENRVKVGDRVMLDCNFHTLHQAIGMVEEVKGGRNIEATIRWETGNPRYIGKTTKHSECMLIELEKIGK